MRLQIALVAAAAMLVFTSASAPAGDVKVGDIVRFWDREGSSAGGEFGVTNLTTPSNPEFRTFCLERNEYIDFNAAGFKVASIATYATAGGVAGSSGGQDPLDPRTAYLYTQFRAGTLSNYNYVANSAARIASANELQEAFWAIEESQPANGQAATWVTEAALAIANNQWTGLGNVRVMNIVWATTRSGFTAGTNAQSQLMLVPTPQAAAAGLSLLAVIGVARVVKRRREQLD